MLSGDAEDDQEAYLVDTYGARLQSTVLKAGHHGSSSSSSGAFLDAVGPRVAVISSAYDSQYGHPHEEVLQRFTDRSVSTYWTATHGDIVFVSDGTNISVRTQRDAPTEPQSLRDGDPIEPGRLAMSWNGPRSVVVEPSSLLPTAETPRMTQPVAMTRRPPIRTGRSRSRRSTRTRRVTTARPTST